MTLEADAGRPTAPTLAAFKQSRVLYSEVLLAAPTTTTTASATGLTATSTVFKESRVLFIEALSGPTTPGPAGFTASPASSPPSCPATPELAHHSEESAADEDDGSVLDPLLRLDATAPVLVTRVVEQCELIELAVVPTLNGALDVTELWEAVEDAAGGVVAGAVVEETAARRTSQDSTRDCLGAALAGSV